MQGPFYHITHGRKLRHRVSKNGPQEGRKNGLVSRLAEPRESWRKIPEFSTIRDKTTAGLCQNAADAKVCWTYGQAYTTF